MRKLLLFNMSAIYQWLEPSIHPSPAKQFPFYHLVDGPKSILMLKYVLLQRWIDARNLVLVCFKFCCSCDKCGSDLRIWQIVGELCKEGYKSSSSVLQVTGFCWLCSRFAELRNSEILVLNTVLSCSAVAFYKPLIKNGFQDSVNRIKQNFWN